MIEQWILDKIEPHKRAPLVTLREYRTHLIADVVTGKFDVRDAPANLPDEADQPERLGEASDLAADDETMADDLDAIPAEVLDAEG